MKHVYNEGRVVGLSAYELYVRQLLSLDPEAIPVTEREWLSSTLTSNSSMILRIPKGTLHGYHDYMLPKGSQLCAATSIYGSMFAGKVETDEDGFWATRVTDYGCLISNVPGRSPSTPGLPQDVPAKENPNPLTPEMITKAFEFVKVVEAIVIQPGEWDEIFYEPMSEELQVLDKGFKPDLSKRAFIRLFITEDIKEDVLLFLHGFSSKAIVNGQFGIGDVSESTSPEDGDFLGPALFPWSCPVVLMITSEVNSALNFQNTFNYKLLENRINYLGSLHSTAYETELLTDEFEDLLTDENEGIMIDIIDSVLAMWEEQGNRVPYYVPVVSEENIELWTEDGLEILGGKMGTVDEALAEGGVL